MFVEIGKLRPALTGHKLNAKFAQVNQYPAAHFPVKVIHQLRKAEFSTSCSTFRRHAEQSEALSITVAPA